MSNSHKDKQWVFNRDITESSPAAGIIRKVMAYSDAMMCVENHVETGADLAEHSHPHSQIVYVSEGRYNFTVGDETREIAKGDTIFISGNLKHSCKCIEGGVIVDFFTPMREDFVK